jgi:hypothetical protein
MTVGISSLSLTKLDHDIVGLMKIRWGRIIVGAVAVEAGAILLLVLVVALFGPNEARAAEAYAEKAGAWVGPIGGAILSFLMAFWIARRLSDGQLAHGALLGLFVALVDVALLVAMRAPFAWLFVASDAGKIIAGVLGGFAAARSSRR